MKVGGSCLSEGSECEQGTVCVGTSLSKRCVEPLENGEACGNDPFWVCEDGLTCRNDICRMPLVKVGESCAAVGSECEKGTVCIGTKTSKRCVKRLEEGESCGSDEFGVCQKELTCRNDICRKALVKVGGSCLAEGSECITGAVCVATTTSKRCVKPLAEGESCGRDPVLGV